MVLYTCIISFPADVSTILLAFTFVGYYLMVCTSYFKFHLLLKESTSV